MWKTIWSELIAGFKISFKFGILAVPIIYTSTDILGTVSGVNGCSMKPTLNSTKWTNVVFLCNWQNRRFEFERGQVVCLISPVDPKEKHIKRIIALEGDTVITRTYPPRYIELPKGHCWIEGDNHEESKDSNQYGPVPLALIFSKATHIVWPPHQWRRIETINVSDRLKKSTSACVCQSNDKNTDSTNS